MESDRSADFSRYKTFAIRAGELNSKNAALNSELVRKQINDDIVRGLTAKGLSRSYLRPFRLEHPLHARFRAQDPSGSLPGRLVRLGTRYVRVPYAEGTLVIDFRDPTTRSLVWRSIASEDKSDPVKLQASSTPW